MPHNLLVIAAALATCQTAIATRIAAAAISNTFAAAAACHELDTRIVHVLKLAGAVLTKGHPDAVRQLRANDTKLWTAINAIGEWL